MKETIKINLNGQLFDLDNDAYERLKNYLDSLETKFKASPSEAKEILEDIESRIAEILNEKKSASKQVTTLADIEEIISLLGTADDIDEPEDSEQEQQNRNTSRPNKKFYRDTQNNILGGVCSGIAAYFGVNILWIRLLFVFLFFFNLAGLIIYLILWFVLPPANTTAQRLEMQGKKVTINDIENSVKKEFENVKSSVKSMQNSQGMKNVEKTFTEILNALGNIILAVLKFAGSVVGIVFIVALILLVIGLFTGGLAFFPFDFMPNFHWPDFEFWPHMSLIGLCIVIIVLIPVMALISQIIKALFNIRSNNKIATGIGTTIWTIAFITLIVLLATNNDDNVLRHTERVSYSLNTGNEPLYIQLNELEFHSDDIEQYHVFNFRFSYNDETDMFLRRPRLIIEPSFGDKVELVVEESYATVKVGRIPDDYGEYIDYDWHLDDTVLNLNNLFLFEDEDSWRVPNVILTLKVPEDQQIYLHDDLSEILSPEYPFNELLVMNDGYIERLEN